MGTLLIAELKQTAPFIGGRIAELLLQAADALESQAREIASKQLTIDGMNEAHWKVVQELAALKPQPGGVVLPERSNERGSDGKLTYEAVAHNRCLDMVARLNQQPASGGDDAERAAFEAVAWRVTGRDGLTVTAQYPKWAEADCLLTITPLYARPAALPVREAVAMPDGWTIAPQEIHLSASDIELINGMCGDGNEESGYGPYQDGTLYIGYAMQDDGSKVYGLHISCDECPEEGVTTLAEFAAAPSPSRK